MSRKQFLVNAGFTIATLVLFFTSCSNPNTDIFSRFENNNPVVTIPSTVNVEVEGYTQDSLIPQPLLVSATPGNFADRVVVSWQQVSYKSYPVFYHVFRSEDGINYNCVTADEPTSFVQYVDMDNELYQLSPGTSYYYVVVSVIPAIKKMSNCSLIVEGYTLGAPSTFSATLRKYYDKIELTWASVPGAKYYIIKRAIADANGNPPAFYHQYQAIPEAVSGTSYVDYAVSKNGDVISQNEYWYILYACSDKNTMNAISAPVKGAILAVGAPPQPVLINVTKGVFSEGIRVMWADMDADQFILYRITQQQLNSGNFSGTEILIEDTNPQFGRASYTPAGGDPVDYCYYYDLSSDASSGNAMYYRVSGKNDIGIGQGSAFSSEFDFALSLGYGIGEYSDTPISVLVSRVGFKLSWPQCPGVSEYYVFRSEHSASAPEFTGWTYLSKTSSLNYIDSASGYNLESDELFYRVLPADSRFVSELNAVSMDYTFFSNLDLNLIDTELTGLVDDPVFGSAGYSAEASDYTVPVPVFSVNPSATKDNPTYRGTVFVTGTISDTTNLSKLNVKLVRTARYGDETGVHPLNEPRKSIGGVSFTKKGLPHVEAVEEFDLKPYLNYTTGKFEFLDPMHDFRDGQPIPDSSAPDGFRRNVWHYAAWDREAWKDMKRQKPFDINRACKIDYEVRIERPGDPGWNPTVVNDTGWPTLTDIEFAHLANWLKDTALNRGTLILVPRYAWENTLSLFMSASYHSQEFKGEYNRVNNTNGKIYLYVNINIMAQKANGQGGIKDGYSDWPGISVGTYDNNNNFKELAMTIENVYMAKKEVNVWSKVTTPLYNGVMHLSCYVRDYNYHWGIYPNAGNEGYVYCYYKGREFELKPGQIIVPMDDKTGSVMGWEAFDNGDEQYPVADFTDFCFFTRINFKYRPYPCNKDFKKEDCRHYIYYGLNY